MSAAPTAGATRRVGDEGGVVTSELGTKAHWDAVYTQEIRNFEETGDEGEVWFGYPVVRKMVEWYARGRAVMHWVWRI